MQLGGIQRLVAAALRNRCRTFLVRGFRHHNEGKSKRVLRIQSFFSPYQSSAIPFQYWCNYLFMAVEYRSLQDSAILVQAEEGKSGDNWQRTNPDLASEIAQTRAEVLLRGCERTFLQHGKSLASPVYGLEPVCFIPSARARFASRGTLRLMR